jgi:peptidoglycan/LPS O-acetylase OafA/YrhL
VDQSHLETSTASSHVRLDSGTGGALQATEAHSPSHSTRKYAFIDALRGYAVLFVITCHTGGMFPELPYPVKRMTNFGAHGVQLFFIVSCVTLLMSWRSEERKGNVSAGAFWLRRFFRIAPMYYAAAFFYFIVEPPPTGFNLGQLITTITFVNAWHPLWTPTASGQWTVVPGGWSIGVEFTFYFFFPIIATLIRSMRSAMLFFGFSILLGSACNPFGYPGLAQAYGTVATTNFLYLWFPHQLPVFALGTILYLTIAHLWENPTSPVNTQAIRWSYPIIGASLITMIFLANLDLAGRLWPDVASMFPTLIVTSFIFMALGVILAVDRTNILINRPICALGEVSFSAYILHFFVLHKIPVFLPMVFDRSAVGWDAIVTCLGLWGVAVALTFGLIESPMIMLGRNLIGRRTRVNRVKQAAPSLLI